MVQVRVKGIDINFPFQPYKCQLDYMEKVITCLQEKKNGALESPTGTGKTLCLLCATLAWRETFLARSQLNQSVMKTNGTDFKQELMETLECATGFDDSASHSVPKVIYASRTHSQLSQAVNELKNTAYRPKVCVLGSRDQMCLNQEVLKQETSAGKVYACKAKIASRSCIYYNNLEAHKENPDFKNDILDIEDIGKLGNKHGVCPYFMSRELKSNADMIFMPYNYLLDFKSRHAHSIDLANTVILLDEAHNVEKICEESASFDLTSYDLACCQEDCDECIQILNDCSELQDDEEKPTAGNLLPEDAAHLKKIFKNIENMIERVELIDDQFVAEGSFLYKELNTEKINATTVGQIIDAIDKCNTLLANNVNKAHRGKHFAMQKMVDVLKILFFRSGEASNMNLEVSRYYKVFIHTEKMTQFQRSKLDIWSTSAQKSAGRTLSYWCFHPGLTMKDLIKYDVRSLILTSGTLSPMNSFTSELSVPFPIQLQNPHVIDEHQIFVGIISKGPDGEVLNSSFHTRYTDKYQNSLGNLIVNISRTTPNGLLVFFPSYPVMEKSLESWHQNGILKAIEKCKAYFAEPRDKKKLNFTMEQFYEKVKDPELKGAIFFAVCRGKVSEGLDFANENGRVVIITGLPFPPKMDPKVKLKMRYLDDSEQKYSLSGRQWYRQQASRAVNQAIGRVIRHSKDYGAILLCDVRFTYADALDQLPVWVKPHVMTYPEYAKVQRHVVHFFKMAYCLFHVSNNDKEDDILSGEHKDIIPYQTNSSQVKKPSIPSSREQQPFIPCTYNTKASNSLKALKVEDKPTKKTSIFRSFGDCEKRGKETKNLIELTVSKSILDSNQSIDSTEGVRTKSKKFKIVTKKTCDTKQPDTKQPNKDIKESENVSKKSRLEALKHYIGLIKDNVSHADYKKFCSFATSYKKTYDINLLIEHLSALLLDNVEHYNLFHGFKECVRNDQKEIFDEAYRKFKKEAQAKLEEKRSVMVKEPVAKKQKFDVKIEVNDKRPCNGTVQETDQQKESRIPNDSFFPVLSDDDSDPDIAYVNNMLNPKCIICTKKVIAPHKAPCQHMACYTCWIKRLERDKNCPKCSKKVRPQKLEKIFFT